MGENQTPEGGQQECISLRIPPDIVPEAKTILEQHGCHVEEEKVILPLGSIRREHMGERTISERYTITLPDGYQLIEVFDRVRTISILQVQPEGKRGRR